MNEPLRVSFCLTNSGIGGTELNALRTAEQLDRDRFDLEVISLNDYAPLRTRYEAAGIPFRVLPIRSLKSPDMVRQGWALARHLRDRRTEVFHAHDSYGNLLGVPWARLARVRAVIASRRWWQSEPRPGHKTGNRCVFRLAHAVLTNTPAVAELVAQEGVPRKKIRVVPNFLDEASFIAPTRERAMAFLTEMGVPEGAPVVGIVANLRPEKDHLTLIRAAGRIAAQHPDAHFVLVGEGDRREEIEALRASLRLEDRVHLAGLRQDDGNLHHVFDVSVLCSSSEALSNSILEAFAAAKPVVATDVGGNPDPVKNGHNGILVPVGDDEALAGAIDRLLSNPDEARRMGRNGREDVKQTYTQFAALTALEDLYRSLLGADRSAYPPLSAHAA